MDSLTTWFVLASLVGLLALLAASRVQAYKLFAGLLGIYYLSGLIDTESMLTNFVNPALATLVLLIVVSFALERTNWIQAIARLLFVKNLTRSYLRMGLLVGLSSAFLNNTAVVATLLSSVRANPYHAVSKLLIPLSYFAILGGTLTLVGTSTNLIVNSFVVDAGLPELSLFDFMYVGLPLLIGGTLIIVIMAKKTLPDIEQDLEESHEYLIEGKLPLGSPLHGKTVQEAGLRELGNLFLVQVYRDGHLISPVTPQQRLQENDRLLFSGDIQEADKLMHIGLQLQGEKAHLEQQSYVEVVLAHTSNLVGTTIKEAGFRNKFDAAVLAIHRGGKTLKTRLADTVLQAGDSLVLVTGPDFEKRENLRQNFYFYSGVEAKKYLSTKQSIWLGISFFSVLGLSALDFLPLLKGLMILLAGLFIFKLLTFGEIKRRFPYELLIVIGSALGIATVMMQTGVSAMIANTVMELFSGWGLIGSLIGVYLFTLLLTELVTNNAAAAIGFPIALTTSELLGVSPWPFIMVVAYGASASFLTPYGYQTNLMVYGAGGYAFKHYVQTGLPVTLFYSLVVLALVPYFFPF